MKLDKRQDSGKDICTQVCLFMDDEVPLMKVTMIEANTHRGHVRIHVPAVGDYLT